MEKWVPAALILVLLAGSGGGYLFTSNLYKPQIASLENQLSLTQQTLDEKTKNYTDLNDKYQTLNQAKITLESTYNSLNSNYNNLKTNYDSLESTYNSLNSNYNALNSQYNTLKNNVDSGFVKLSSDYVDLKKQYDSLSQMVGSSLYGTPGDTTILKYYYQLTKDVRSLNATLWEYCNLRLSFKNTLTISEVMKVENTVRTIIGSSTDEWSNYQNIHQYVTSNIQYVYDIDFPCIMGYKYVDVNGVRYLTEFNTSTIQNYVQKPQFTLEYKQGDCDDQAALEYAMLRYYNKYIVGTDYNLYVADIEFSDGNGHAAVFMPVQGGALTIFDPAGHYLTSSSSTIAAKPAASELEVYNTHWASIGSITHITLYWVNLTDGSSNVVAQGTRAEVAAYLSK